LFVVSYSLFVIWGKVEFKQQPTNNQQPTTNNQQPTTNNQQQTTNNLDRKTVRPAPFFSHPFLSIFSATENQGSKMPT